VCLGGIGQITAFPALLDRNWTAAPGLIVAHDVLGGVFLINGLRPGPGRPGVPGEVIGWGVGATCPWPPAPISAG